MTVHVSIGNSDDKLSQADWSAFCAGVDAVIRNCASTVFGVWYSEPSSQWQNACWAFEPRDALSRARAREALSHTARIYRQDSIAWTDGVPDFIWAATL